MKNWQCLYQPGRQRSTIIWSWTIVLVALATILQLEVLTFNWIVIVLYLLAVLVIIWNLRSHRLTVNDDGMILGRCRPLKARTISWTEIKSAVVEKRTVTLELTRLDQHQVQLLLGKKGMRQMKTTLQAQHLMTTNSSKGV
ncbi:hypothetical protein IV38_GL000367 [Lactobacillus selangorensis]|uniref:Pore-forming protein n=1 Tax=Lactobacillus selangorensis TaxID=81857 RepID=A0A0R2GAZ7_9LACO|nr:EbsA family protein [Lactobacillus selangorensis]KRN29482.1 hypothetical protein IV38_GL000367 [Lactobacillus selangorensis]KRN33988.1 hypothetical protein IV40_GL000301 [Lactobacillus selangorensis]